MNKKGWIITVSVVLGSVLLAGIVWGGVSLSNTMNALGDYKNQLEYVYERNFYELTDNVNNIESNLAKLKITNDNELQARYLGSVVALSNTAQNNIAVLPIEHNAINSTISFVNQLSGFCLILEQNLAQNKKITNDDMQQIDEMYEACKNIKYELNRLSTLIAGDYKIVDNVKDPNKYKSGFNDEFSSLNNEIVDYPQLIYDGPFSESTTNKTVKGLSENLVNKEEAYAKMQEWFDDFDIKYNGETVGGNFDTFDFILSKNNIEYYAQVTQRDGILLQLNGDVESTGITKSEDECCTIAENFAKKLGFDDVKAVWSAVIGGYVYVNLTPVINDVIIYPDMIKVKIDKVSGLIVGWEAKSWAYNHTERNNFSPTIDEIQARQSLSMEMDVCMTKLAIIPNEYVGETLCYEFMCISDGATYYIYVNAKTGKQANILKIVETDDGNLLM